MSTIDRKPLLAPAVSLACLFFLLNFALPGHAAAGSAASGRFFAGVAAGYFYPGQNAFREIYDKPIWPLGLDLGWNLGRKWSVLGGVRYLRASGNTILLAARQPDETYTLRLEILNLRLGLNYWFRQARFTPFLGAGGLCSFYREEWLTVPREVQGRKAGFFVQAGVRYRLGRRLHALGQLEYASVPAGRHDGAEDKVNLGGLSMMLGVTAAVF